MQAASLLPREVLFKSCGASTISLILSIVDEQSEKGLLLERKFPPTASTGKSILSPKSK
jgi:hypothetical protein